MILLFLFFALLLAIVVLMSIQLYMTRKLLQVLKHHAKCGNEMENATGKVVGRNEHDNETEKKDIFKRDGTKDSKKEETSISCRDQVLDAVRNRSYVICEEDLPNVKEDLLNYFEQYTNSDYFKSFDSKDYYRFIDLRAKPTARVVVVGDIHCDYPSLAAILLKLSTSDYDYFSNAYFIFLGDYIDRGSALFEPLLLLKDLKEILGDRMIMLKGNHESIEYDELKQILKPRVLPHETCDCLNKYCGNDKNFLKQFATFYSTLPTYVYLKTEGRNMLLTHAAIPRDMFIDKISFDEQNGAMVFSTNTLVEERLSMRNKICKDMIWGDPSPYNEKIQVDGRFEFGRKQFDRWISRNPIDLLLRSHEEAANGYTPFFDDRLFTIFSTGGTENPQTGYPKVQPAFSIIQNDQFIIENSFIYLVRKETGTKNINLLNKQVLTDKQIANFKMSEEFVCDESKCKQLREMFKSMVETFSSTD